MDTMDILNRLVGASLTTIDSVSGVRKSVQYLAHYTSIAALQGICRTGQLWFSNPQFMNDLQEMNYGLNAGYDYVLRTRVIENAFSKSKDETLYHRQQFSRYIHDFMTTQSSEVYIFCTTAHDVRNEDGALSMWRGYGEGGRGAALIFNTGFLRDRQDSPLLIAEVQYMSEDQRMASIWQMLQRWQIAATEIDKSNFNEAHISAVMQSLFVSILLLALTTKHPGFSEEREWRLIYLPFLGNAAVLKDSLSYNVGPRGVEPKLKFPLAPLPLDPPDNWTFDSIVHKLLLGPGMSDRLHRAAVERMLVDHQKSFLCDRLKFSTIPLRL